MRNLTLAAALAALSIGSGCAEPASPTSPDLAVTPTTELFLGTLPVRGTRFYSYTVTQSGTVSLTLASLTTATSRTVTDHVTLGVGVPAGTGCGLHASTTTSASLTSQLQHSSTPGIYCVNVADSDGLPSAVAFAIRIVHP